MPVVLDCWLNIEASEMSSSCSSVPSVRGTPTAATDATAGDIQANATSSYAVV